MARFRINENSFHRGLTFTDFALNAIDCYFELLKIQVTQKSYLGRK